MPVGSSSPTMATTLAPRASASPHPGLSARLGNIAGKPIELVSRALPEAASNAIGAATTKARWCGGKLRIHRPLPGGGAGALRGAPARTSLRQECCPSRIRAVLLRDRSRRLSRAAQTLHRGLSLLGSRTSGVDAADNAGMHAGGRGMKTWAPRWSSQQGGIGPRAGNSRRDGHIAARSESARSDTKPA